MRSGIDLALEVLTNAREQLIPYILCDQGTDGLWMTEQGLLNPDDGSTVEMIGQVENVGLHAFIIEQLLIHWNMIPEVRAACVKGLRALALEAVRVDDQWLWRWMKKPTRKDFLYPPDYDDTARAIATLHLGRSLLTRDEWLDAIEGVCWADRPFDVSAAAIRDICSLDRDLRVVNSGEGECHALYTFMGGYSAKANNTVDPVVNANILYALTLEDCTATNANASYLIRELQKYLSIVLRDWEHISPRFSDFSHYYLSPLFWAYICSQINHVNCEVISDDFMAELAENVAGYLTNRVLRIEEAAWALIVLCSIDGHYDDLATHLAKYICTGLKPKLGVVKPAPIYQHKRLNHVYTSKVCSTLFCLEGLKTFMDSKSNGRSVDQTSVVEGQSTSVLALPRI
jgi:hypothetical protein